MTQDVQKREYIAQQFELWGHKAEARIIRGNANAKIVGLQALESSYVTSAYYEKKTGKSFSKFHKEMKEMLSELRDPNPDQTKALDLYNQMLVCAHALYNGEDPEREGYTSGDSRLIYYSKEHGFAKDVSYRNAKESLCNYVIDPDGEFQALLIEWNHEVVKYFCPFKTETKFEAVNNKLTNYLMEVFDQ